MLSPFEAAVTFQGGRIGNRPPARRPYSMRSMTEARTESPAPSEPGFPFLVSHAECHWYQCQARRQRGHENWRDTFGRAAEHRFAQIGYSVLLDQVADVGY